MMTGMELASNALDGKNWNDGISAAFHFMCRQTNYVRNSHYLSSENFPPLKKGGLHPQSWPWRLDDLMKLTEFMGVMNWERMRWSRIWLLFAPFCSLQSAYRVCSRENSVCSEPDSTSHLMIFLPGVWLVKQNQSCYKRIHLMKAQRA